MKPSKRYSLEICVDNIEGLHIADQAGVDHIELCSALGVGGLTPSYGLAIEAASLRTPIAAMIRPRTGDFTYSGHELNLMKIEIQKMQSIGIDGVVFGVADSSGLDIDANKALIKAAGKMSKTLHRCFDLIEDQINALEDAIELGFDRILTSGGQLTAADGAEQLRKLIDAADGRIQIMAGSGVNISNVEHISSFGVTHFHASCSQRLTAKNSLVNFGFASHSEVQTDQLTITALQEKLNSVG